MAAILVYHRIAQSASDVHGLCVPASDFRSQMEYARQQYSVMPLHELLRAVRLGRVPTQAVAITFDDGYVDNFTHASPILADLGIPATFFLTSDRLSENYQYWWDVLEQIFFDVPSKLPHALEIDLAARHLSLPTNSDHERSTAHATLHLALLNESAEARDSAVAHLLDWSGYHTSVDPTRRRMDAAQILALSRRPGHDIGAHSVRHVALPKQTPAVQEMEIRNSGADLRSLTGQPVLGFAYPFGATNEETCAIASQWFDYALTTQAAQLTATSPIYRLPRFEVRTDRAIAFDEWLHGAVGHQDSGRSGF